MVIKNFLNCSVQGFMCKSIVMHHKNEYNEIYNYINSVDTSSMRITFCERFDEKSRIWNFKKHYHDYIEFIYFLDGRARIDVPGKQVNLSLYDLIVYPPGVLHQEFLDMHCHQEIICIGVDVDSKARLETSFELGDRSGKLRWLLEQIYEEHSNKEDGFEEVVQAYLKSFFLLLQRYYKNVEGESGDIVNRCVRYIHDHFSEELTMDKLTSLVFVSPSYLTRVFQKRLGISPMHYVNAYRIETAKRLLRSGSFSIMEVSDFTGFKDQKYFSRIFKKYTKTSPRDFRKTYGTESQP